MQDARNMQEICSWHAHIESGTNYSNRYNNKGIAPEESCRDKKQYLDNIFEKDKVDETVKLYEGIGSWLFLRWENVWQGGSGLKAYDLQSA